jgi:biotin--protein ligase
MSPLSAALDSISGEMKPKDNILDYSKIVKRIAAHEEAWPEPKETPYFNHAVYYSSLQEYRERDGDAETWGDAFMYGEVVTSTNTLLEKYATRPFLCAVVAVI